LSFSVATPLVAVVVVAVEVRRGGVGSGLLRLRSWSRPRWLSRWFEEAAVVVVVEDGPGERANQLEFAMIT